jgi:sarcosine oxidase delta subunit
MTWYFIFICVRFFRAQRGKTAHKMISKHHAAAGKKCASE